jgi:putative transposase
MEIVYRTLVLKYDLLRLPPEIAEKISALLKVQEEFRRWATGWALSGGSLPPPEHNPLKHFAIHLLYAGGALDWLKGVKKNVEVKKMRPPLVFDAQLRLKSERDISRGVFIDLPRKVIRIRKWSNRRGNTIVLPLREDAEKWILARVREGGRLVLAAVWIGERRSRGAGLYVALVFRREVAAVEAKRLLVVDFNALHNGVAWAVVEGERIVTKGVMKPNVSKILHLQKAASRLDSACAERDKICSSAMATKKRVWRLLRSWEDEMTKKLAHLALQYRAAVIVDVPEDSSVRALKEGGYSPERKALLNFGRLRRRLKGLVEWYGISYREERLYSTMCPHCERKMRELPNRRVKCQCGFEMHRDEVPFHWAIKRFSELTSFFNSSFSPSAAVVGVLIFKLMRFVSS